MSTPTHLPRLPITLALAALLVTEVGAGRRPHLPKPRRGSQIVVGPTAVPRGGEVTACNYLKLPTRHDLAVNRVDIKVRGGSHHIHLYRPHDRGFTVPDGAETCDFALDFSQWGLILASQTPLLRWKLPAGVAFHFAAGEQLAAQTHYVDTGLLETKGEGWSVINLHAMPAERVIAWAGAFFGQDRDVVVPPRAASTATTKCVFPRPVKLLAATGHYHFRGVRFTAAAWDGARTGAPFYSSVGYEEPSFVRWGADTAPEVTGVEWTCTYHNDTDETYGFGPFTENNEHCNLFMFYYPALGQHEVTTCVQEHGVAEVAVRGE